MKAFIIISLTLNSFQIFSQSKKIDANILKIDNAQFQINHEKKAGFSLESRAAMKLIKIGKPATVKLINALDNPDKIILAHLILCHIWFKHVSFAGPKTISTDNGNVNKYYLGEEKGEGLIISEINNKKYVEASDIQKIKIYWEKKIKN